MKKTKIYKNPDGTDEVRDEYTENGKFHRIDGPAIRIECELEAWYFEGLLHRDGNLPAISDYKNKYQAYFEHGVCIKTMINDEVKFER